MRRTPLLVSLALALVARADDKQPKMPPAAPRIANGAWARLLREHPRLQGGRAWLRARAEERPEAWKEIAQQDGLAFAAARHAVVGLDAAAVAPLLERARKHVAKGPSNLHQDTWLALDEVARTLDAFHGDLLPEERARWIEWLNAHLKVFSEDEGAFHNSTLSKIRTYLVIAYATWGENPRAGEFRDHALTKLWAERVAPVLREFGQGGGLTECGWYARGSLLHLVEGLELARRFEKQDPFAAAPRFFYQRLAYELLQAYPGAWTYGAERYPCEGDGSLVYGGHNESPRHARTLIAQYFRGSELARLTAAKRRKGSNPESRLWDFLWEEEPDPQLAIEQAPLAHHASGIGRVYARSDWSDGATWFRFECGPYFSGHQHLEAGNFEVFHKEPLATESGEYEDYGSPHAVNWLLRTIAHNCVLVHSPNETWSKLRDGGKHAPYANDGGQRKSWDWTVATLQEWQARQESFERGAIMAYVDRPELLWVAADPTRAYAPEKLERWTRQIVFLRPNAFVILDRVVARKAEYAKTWLLHTKNEPALDAGAIRIEDGKGRLFVKTLLPQDAKQEKVHGYGYAGKSWDPPKNSQSDAAAKWRVEVRPGAARQEDLFLHVLITGGDLPSIGLLEKAGRVGAKIGEAEVWLETRAIGGTVELGSKKVKLEPKVERGRFE